MEAITQLRIRFNSERDPAFTERVREMPGGERLDHCIQCGTCSGTCPLSIYMDITPRRVLHLVRSGFKDEILGCNTIWLCSSCYSCTVECPKEIKITDIMYSLKRLAIEGHQHPKRMPIPVLAEEFIGMVAKYGRIHEGILATRLFLRHKPTRLLKNAGLGLKLMKRGRFGLRQDRIENRAQLRKLLESNGTSNGHGGTAQ